ncbi:exopolyphosphatase [Prevotella sp. HMSC073D09]|uniref:DHH family phosphoesterase n=1 Tax=Prevotella sp. HMSC073D09 TaxID=1739459 RepID=UPI0008A19CC8|nr:DHH family phosphoesterase [Prevotella sp. HMSC073D09]OFQ08114.1 exopolyphosphatase [Prevotella sp. HMSC073D09]
MQLEILSQSDSNTLNGLIQVANNIVICCHKSPDGDAIGSSLAWAEYLRQVGKKPLIIVPDAFPDFLKWLPGVEKVMRYDKHTAICKERIAEADLIFCLDFNATNRVDDMQHALETATAQRVVFDHHLNPQMDACLMVSLPQMSSTCEIVFRIVWQLGGFEMFSRQAAIAVYCGMMTDTGGFTYNSTRPEIYVIIGHLLTKGFDKDKVYRNVYNNYSSWAIRFRGYLMSQKLNVLNELNASYFCITRQDMKNFHFVKGDAEGLVNEPLRIKGQKLVISLREDTDKDNLILVSLRSVDDFPCNEMAERFFNGGGHLNASGGKLFCSMSEAERVVRDAIMAYSGRLRA